MATGSVKAVVAALAGNMFVAAIKLIAFVLSGSGAMLSEAIHSAADTGNQILLLIGLRRGEREPDDRFPYGYGGERFIFGMLSAAGIFFIGSGITVYHGITSLLEPRLPQVTAVTFIVLAASFVIEGSVFLYVARGIALQRGELSFVRYVRERADPASVAILLEDGAAVLGLFIAAAGIGLADATGDPTWDAVASILVGCLLAAVAFYLAHENRELLLGRAVPEGIEDRLVEIIRRQPSVRDVRDVKTRQLTPEAFTLKAEITFDNEHLAKRIDQALTRDRALPPATLHDARRGSVLERIASVATDLIASEIAAIEAAVRAEVPQARHIDLEVAQHLLAELPGPASP
ncbi:MAG: cation diffusion facilitator family transporter [Deltaproteobacteria bacterium]|nr:cation diffusion facilitator family transporter [Deltaproteobacteria bacterium]MCW5805215.1 cation diffusion facilitator family transporter [Deltaproteobacteria bacterium]